MMWPLAGGVAVLPDIASGGYAQVLAASHDGSVIVGGSFNGVTNVAAKWTSAGAVVTALASLGASEADWCSQDASVIGGALTTADGHARWTSGGATGAVLPPAGGYISSAGQYTAGSDDGTIIIGSSVSPAGTAPTIWTNGTPSLLAVPPAYSLVTALVCVACSNDAATLIIALGSPLPSGFNGTGSYYWLNGSFHQLGGVAYEVCNGNGSIVWGQSSGPVYWDNLAAVDGDGFGGTVHRLDVISGDFPATAYVVTAAARTDLTVAVGYGPNDAGALVAIKWNGTSATALPSLSNTHTTIAHGVSGDGSIVVGRSTDSSGDSHAVYWDAGNAVHILPMPPYYSESEAFGISRDGTTVWGSADYSPPDPPPGGIYPDPPMVFLSWSDDRGHSFGNPVGISLGAIGEYVTSLQWQRLGMGRSRVFQLEWSSPVRTALMGAWVDRTPALT